MPWDVGGIRQMDSAIQTARGRGGTGVRACLTPYLGWGSVGGLPLALAGPARLLCVWVGGGGRGGDASEEKRAAHGARAGRVRRSCAAGPIPKGGGRRRCCPWPCRFLPHPAGGWGGRGGGGIKAHAREGEACTVYPYGLFATSLLLLLLVFVVKLSLFGVKRLSLFDVVRFFL